MRRIGRMREGPSIRVLHRQDGSNPLCLLRSFATRVSFARSVRGAFARSPPRHRGHAFPRFVLCPPRTRRRAKQRSCAARTACSFRSFSLRPKNRATASRKWKRPSCRKDNSAFSRRSSRSLSCASLQPRFFYGHRMDTAYYPHIVISPCGQASRHTSYCYSIGDRVSLC